MKWLGLHLTGFDARGRLLLDVGPAPKHPELSAAPPLPSEQKRKKRYMHDTTQR